MNYIRNNWSRLSLALLFLLGGILGIVAFAGAGSDLFGSDVDSTAKFFNIALLISAMVYFFGMVCITVLKTLASKKTVSLTYMVMGLIITVLNFVVMFVCLNRLSLIDLNAYFNFTVPTLVFGLYPLIKGVTRFIEAEHTPAPVKADVKPAVKEEVAPAEAPKAPAKKATKASAK